MCRIRRECALFKRWEELLLAEANSARVSPEFPDLLVYITKQQVHGEQYCRHRSSFPCEIEFVQLREMNAKKIAG
jgi:hypothetical protein